MELKAIQVCYSTEGWSPVRVDSHSNPDQQHMVLVNPYVTLREFVCDCPGFLYRGECRHQEEALQQTCWWPIRPGVNTVEQTAKQQRDKRCPVCDGPTKWEMVEVEDG